MLPDWPKLKNQMVEKMFRHAQRTTSADGYIFATLPKQKQHEGSSSIITRSDGTEDSVKFNQVTASISITPEEVRDLSDLEWQNKFLEAALHYVRQVDLGAIEELKNAAEAAGTVSDAKGEPFTIDLFLKNLENVLIPFNEQGEMILPTIVTGKALGESVRRVFEEAKSDKVALNKIEVFKEKKRREWIDREASRKLVD